MPIKNNGDFKGIVLMLNHVNIKFTINIIIKMHAYDKNNLKINIHNIKIIK